jgi:hypothetical protein
LLLRPDNISYSEVNVISSRKSRQIRLADIIENDPLTTDEELALKLHVSVSTVRLDRALLGIPELRERTKKQAQEAMSRLRSLSLKESVGELLELEPNKWALSVLRATRDMAFRNTKLIWDLYIFAQASSLAVAVIEADMVIVDSMRGECKGHAHVGEDLVARAKVGVNKEGTTIVSVRTKVVDQEIFVGRFITKVLSVDS